MAPISQHVLSPLIIKLTVDMRNALADDSIQERGIEALYGVSTVSARIMTSNAAFDSFRAINEAMSAHESVQRLQRKACRALATLCHQVCAMEKNYFRNSNILTSNRVMKAVSKYPDDPDILLSSFTILLHTKPSFNQYYPMSDQKHYDMISIDQALALLDALVASRRDLKTHLLGLRVMENLLPPQCDRSYPFNDSRIFAREFLERGGYEVALHVLEESRQEPKYVLHLLQKMYQIANTDAELPSLLTKKGVIQAMIRVRFSRDVYEVCCRSTGDERKSIVKEHIDTESVLSRFKAEIASIETKMSAGKAYGIASWLYLVAHIEGVAPKLLHDIAVKKFIHRHLASCGSLCYYLVYSHPSLAGQVLDAMIFRIKDMYEISLLLAKHHEQKFGPGKPGSAPNLVNKAELRILEIDRVLEAFAELCSNAEVCQAIADSNLVVEEVLSGFDKTLSEIASAPETSTLFKLALIMTCEATLQALINLAKRPEYFQAQITRGRGPALMIKCMRIHTHYPAVSVLACETLYEFLNFTNTEEVMAQVRECDGDQVVLLLIISRPGCYESRLHGCGILVHCYLTSPQGRDSMFEEAITSLVGGMVTFSHEAKYQVGACRLLRDVTQNPEGVLLACKAAAINALFRARRMENDQVVSEANKALDAFRKCGESVMYEIEECEEREREEAKTKKSEVLDSDSGDVVGEECDDTEHARQKRSSTSCAACGKQAHEVGIKKLHRCDACTIAPRYCSAECQKAMWPTHKVECRAHRVTN
jgi:hypothetical protein